MGGSMSQIVPGVYVGGLYAAKSKQHLSANKITHLCTVLNQEVGPLDKPHVIFRADDSPTENLSRYFEEACFFIHDARNSGGCVLIHCACGVSRSVTVTLAYLLVISDFSLADLFKAVQGARHCACPNYGFVQQLKDFEAKEAAIVRKKLVDRFGVWPPERREADAEALKAALEVQNYFILNGEYPGENSLENAIDEATDPSFQGKPIFTHAPPPVHHLDSSFYTVYSQGKPRDLGEFLLARSRAADSDVPCDEPGECSD